MSSFWGKLMRVVIWLAVTSFLVVMGFAILDCVAIGFPLKTLLVFLIISVEFCISVAAWNVE